MASDDKGDYIVGYRRPPKDKQFKPGESGNAKGRPRGRRSARQLRDKALNAMVSVKENGRVRKVSVIEASYIKLQQLALQGGNKWALSTLFAWADEFPKNGSDDYAERGKRLMKEMCKRMSESAIDELRRAHTEAMRVIDRLPEDEND